MHVINIMTLGYPQGRTLIKNNFAHAATRTEDGRQIARSITITDSAQLIDDIKSSWLLSIFCSTL
jgi:hypothetical protein